MMPSFFFIEMCLMGHFIFNFIYFFNHTNNLKVTKSIKLYTQFSKLKYSPTKTNNIQLKEHTEYNHTILSAGTHRF